jgi:hypothetical protein
MMPSSRSTKLMDPRRCHNSKAPATQSKPPDIAMVRFVGRVPDCAA